MTKKVQFSIEGMHCGSCAAGIKMVLDNTGGVLNATADWDSKSGGVEYDDEKIKLEDILKVIEELGYKATPKS
ncbi:heavy-metal-associated domain-containing protein [Patescibacteria group bacterium]|nr:heavy-metal-associated domain-containing protein [Patescibacteria group bacterium]